MSQESFAVCFAIYKLQKKRRRAGNEEAEEEGGTETKAQDLLIFYAICQPRFIKQITRNAKMGNGKLETSKSRHRFSLSHALSVSVFLAPSPTYDLGKQPNAHSLKQFSKQTSHSSAASSRQLLTHIFIYKLLILYAQPHARGALPGGRGRVGVLLEGGGGNGE